MIEVDMGDLEKLAEDFSKVAYQYPKKVNSFMSRQALNTAKSIEKQEKPQYKVQQNKNAKNWIPFAKGRYKKSSEREGIKSWWIIKNKVWYERLVNLGHKIMRGKKVVGVVHPTNFIEKGAKSYEPKLIRNFENLVRSLMGDA